MSLLDSASTLIFAAAGRYARWIESLGKFDTLVNNAAVLFLRSGRCHPRGASVGNPGSEPASAALIIASFYENVMRICSQNVSLFRLTSLPVSIWAQPGRSSVRIVWQRLGTMPARFDLKVGKGRYTDVRMVNGASSMFPTLDYQ